MAYLRNYADDARAIHGANLSLGLSGDEVCVEIDPLMFRQVLDNLVDNAIRYRATTPAKVDVCVVREAECIEIRVSDNGIGVAPERIERIFDRFSRLEDRLPAEGRRGMGIGLSIVRSIVRSHGGTVGARSAGRGLGSTMWVRLPTVHRAEVPA